MKLIINADDYGLTKGVSKCIRDLLNDGYIRSTTIMINYATEEDLKELAKIQNISTGLHFTLDSGKACLVSGLTDENGNFKYKKTEFNLNVSKEVIKKELEAQFEKLSRYLKISHIDSHHHVHLRNQNVLEVVQEFAKEKGITYRQAANKFSPDSIPNGTRGYINDFYADGVSKFPRALNNYDDYEVYEMMCHPGYNDQDLERVSSYNKQREYEALKLKELKDIEKERYE